MEEKQTIYISYVRSNLYWQIISSLVLAAFLGYNLLQKVLHTPNLSIINNPILIFEALVALVAFFSGLNLIVELDVKGNKYTVTKEGIKDHEYGFLPWSEVKSIERVYSSEDQHLTEIIIRPKYPRKYFGKNSSMRTTKHLSINANLMTASHIDWFSENIYKELDKLQNNNILPPL